MTNHLNHLQLKAARGVLNLGVREIGSLLNVNKTTVNNAERGKTRDFFYKNSAPLVDFFRKNNIIFPTQYSIRYNDHSTPHLSNHKKGITRFQLKAARLLLSISQKELAKKIGVTEGVIVRLELIDNNNLISPKNPLVIDRLINLFESSNIYFPDEMYVFFKKYMDNSSF